MTPNLTKKHWSLALATSLVVAAVLLPKSAQAAGINVTPAYLSATISKDQPAQDIAVGVRNDSDVPVQLHITLGGIDQRNGGLLIPTTQIDAGLKSALSISPTEFVLEPKQSLNVKLHIQDSPSLSPGGHYASLIITQLNNGSAHLGLRSAVSVTTFLIKEGGAIRAVDALGLQVPHSVFSLPQYVDVDFRGGGNVLVVPRAGVFIGKSETLYGKGVVNLQSIPVLPGKTVKLRSIPTYTAKPKWPTRYKLSVEYRYEGSDITKTISRSYWYIPPVWVLTVVLIMVSIYHFRLVRKARATDWKKLCKAIAYSPRYITKRLQKKHPQKKRSSKRPKK